MWRGGVWARGTVPSCKGLYNLFFSERWGGATVVPASPDQVRHCSLNGQSAGRKKQALVFLGLHTAAKLVGRPHS